ncbi:MAG: serine protease [Deltaproteobacteria bacterium]|nr:serine protease [Deltaproteobacteria bacterium]
MKALSVLVLCLSSSAFASGIEVPVVGGTPVPAGEWPDTVAVLASNAMCSGTLIAPDVVLTAGHCIETHPKLVVVGSVDLARPGGMAIAVKSATAYPSWKSSYDVGVLVLDHAAPAKPRAIASACTVKEHLTAGAKVHVVGFGLTTKAGDGTNTRLHEAMIPIDDAMCTQDSACQPSVAPGGEFTAGGSGVDACFGDSGGPIYIDTKAGPALIGVVSRGEALIGEPCGGGGVYVRADAVARWIEKTTNRTLARSTCDSPADGEGDGDGSDASDAASTGGCSAAREAVGGGALLGLVVLAMLCALPLRRTPTSLD